MSNFDPEQAELIANTFSLSRNISFQSHGSSNVHSTMARKRKSDQIGGPGKKKKLEKASENKLSFALDEEEDEESDSGENVFTFGKINKDPTVDTTYLPDPERDERERIARERLAREWVEKQEKIKNEEISVFYNYVDGLKTLHSIKMINGSTVESFLEKVRDSHSELQYSQVNGLMLVKNLSIIPHDLSFYDLTTSEDFQWDINKKPKLDDGTDNTPADVVEVSFYEKNMHITPYDLWQDYQPKLNEKKEDDDETNKKFWGGVGDYTVLKEDE
eukprot:TRINITY_DN12420_c0_g1_i1.p1 TRINITY_DN12420_c0_g1~~TRINITY_DN12420_c0_g1_i1.p1  ORF type:complete len:274 (-),score=82.81 TRINITY_DN12420_c0_g1_i1:40-861(-)